MGEGGVGADAGDHLTAPRSTTVVYVTYQNDAIDLSWIAPGLAEVLVVHNDGERQTSVDGFEGDIVHLVPPCNLGFGAGVNLAASYGSGQRLLMVNPDALLTARHWDALTVDVDEDEVLTIPLVDGDGVATYSVRAYPTPIRHVLGGFRAGRLAPRGSVLRARAPLPDRDEVFPLATHWASGAVLSMSLHRFRLCGGFDPAFFLYYEDMDLCGRLAKTFTSMRVRLRATPPAVHTVGVSARKLRDAERIRLESAIEWSRRQSGGAWRLSQWLLRSRLARLR